MAAQNMYGYFLFTIDVSIIISYQSCLVWVLLFEKKES